MRLFSIVCASALAVTIGFAASTRPATGAAGATLVSKGKTLAVADHCNGCHGADYNGKPKFAPGLTQSKGPMTHYTKAQFEKLLSTGVEDDGDKVKQPMLGVCKIGKADADAIYAFLKTVK